MAVLVRDTDMPTEEPRAADDGGQLYSQTNIFEAGDSTRALSTPSLGKGRTRGYARSLRDLLIDDAVTSSYHPATVFDVSAHSAVGVEPADLGLRDRIVAGAGWQDTLRGEGWVRIAGLVGGAIAGGALVTVYQPVTLIVACRRNLRVWSRGERAAAWRTPVSAYAACR